MPSRSGQPNKRLSRSFALPETRLLRVLRQSLRLWRINLAAQPVYDIPDDGTSIRLIQGLNSRAKCNSATTLRKGIGPVHFCRNARLLE